MPVLERGMLSRAQALEHILQRVATLDPETLPLLGAQDRVLRAKQASRLMLPPWDNSAMDGFAVRARDLPGELAIAGVVAAGSAPGATLSASSCLKIMTGAPVPAGADAVVMREEVTEQDGRARFSEAPTIGANIRRAGEDVALGSTLLEEGTLLGPGELGLLAAQGIARVPVTRRPRVAILSTGDELVALGTEPGPGQIINCNAITLAAQVREAGAIPVIAGIVPDDLGSTVRSLRSLRDYDVLLTSGGVSVGDFDHVKEAFSKVGIALDFWKVAIKPGKPLAFGVRDGGQLVFGLPGNPASSMVSFELFVRPAIRKLLGHHQLQRLTVPATLADTIHKSPGRAHYVRAQLERRGNTLIASPLSKQGSGMLRSMVSVDCLIELPADSGDAPSGSQVSALTLRGQL